MLRIGVSPVNDIAFPVKRNISNSEVITFLTCKQQYDFAFMKNLTPKKTPKPLARGTLGHLAFQYYIEARLNNANHTQALEHSQLAFKEAMRDNVDVAVVLETKTLYERYQGFHQGWPEWELLGTEEMLELPVTETFTIPMRYDLMVREKDSGRIGCGDFKLTYDFWTVDEHSLNPQMPKYITIMKSNGIDVQFGFLEEIRTRQLGKEKASDHRNLWKRTKYYPSAAKRRSLIKQHVAASLEIVEYRNLPDDEREARTIPVLAKHGACKHCNFKELCASKLDGGDIQHFMDTAFVQNTYGYNETIDPVSYEDIV